MTAFPSMTSRSPRRTGGYWVATAAVVAECAVGGTMSLFRVPPFYTQMLDLGYPSYLATIMGVAKLLAALALAVPGLPRLKEWAYAGVMIDMVGAVVSNAVVHGSAGELVAPTAFAGLAIASWALRPPPRRL